MSHNITHFSRSLLLLAREYCAKFKPKKRRSQLRYPNANTSAYYQRIHETNDAYKRNNWLVPEIDAVLSISPKSILEVGCGNGRFLAAVGGRAEKVMGVDWARSPILDEIGTAIDFRSLDITSDELPVADLVCSADVLEHIPPHLLQVTLKRLDGAGSEQYHVIACYDDGHSHLSIMDPQAWLCVFQSISPRYKIIDIRPRRDDPLQVICVIATFQPMAQTASHQNVQAVLAPPSAEAQ